MSKEEEFYQAAVTEAAKHLAANPAFRDTVLKQLYRQPVIVKAVMQTINSKEIAEKVADYIAKDYLATQWKGKTFLEMVQRESEKIVTQKLEEKVAQEFSRY